MLTAQEAKDYIERIGERLGYDATAEPIFPEGRNDLAVVKHTTENGSTHGFDTIYVVWKDVEGSIRHLDLIDSRTSRDYIHIETVRIESGNLIVHVRSGGTMSGRPWEEIIPVPLANLGLRS
ncbi:MAG: hypothetical protein Q8R13_03955 [bacterium]|nr:hypothetical protein [bacterium]MDZ4295974.1 hypothetical protein [Patescibacteria group bacterium]